VATEQVKYRLSQLESYAVLISNEEYYAASKEMDEISRKNRSAITVDSPKSKRMAELSSVMSRIADQLEPHPATEQETSILDSYEPDPDADYKQLYVGFNGPETSRAETFDSAAMSRESCRELIGTTRS